MTLAFLNMSGLEAILFLSLILAVFIGIGHYGRNTQLGYTGSILLAIFTTPIIAFVVVWYMRSRMGSSVQP